MEKAYQMQSSAVWLQSELLAPEEIQSTSFASVTTSFIMTSSCLQFFDTVGWASERASGL